MSAPATAQPLKLEVGKAYRTRDGRKAVIERTIDNGRWPMVGYIVLDDGTHDGESWTNSGENFQDGEYPKCDLIAEWDAPDADGWIEWSGGECPVPPETVVEVKWGGAGGISSRPAASLDWRHFSHGGNGDITAYRVVTPAPEPKPGTVTTGNLTATPLAEVGVDPGSPSGDQVGITFAGESARRAIACWNACHGVTTEVLADGLLKNLLDVLKQIAAHPGPPDASPDDQATYEQVKYDYCRRIALARAALAKTKPAEEATCPTS